MINATEAHEQASSNALMRQKAMFEAYPSYIKDQIAKIKTAIELAVDEGYFYLSFDTEPLSETDIQKIMDYLSFYHFSLKLTRGRAYETYDPKYYGYILYNDYTIVISW